MPGIGQGALVLVAAPKVKLTAKREAMVWAVAFACVSVLAALAMWGFTVDDALISIRFARHLAMGIGYRFNPNGPSTDGVTPLPWAFLLTPLAEAPAMTVLLRVKVLCMVLHAASMALVGSRLAPLVGRVTALVIVLTCVPFAAYGASGMDTPLATLLCTLSVFFMQSPWAPVFAGLAASIRPELLPWAATISCGFALVRKATPRAVIGAAFIAAAPFTMCAVVRRIVFGHYAPLAVLAKPSDLTHGVAYAIAAVFACAVPILLIARRAPNTARVITFAFGVHVIAVAFAGGDSMPFARLLVPLVPTVLMAHLQIATVSAGRWVCVRFAFALAFSIYVAATAAPRGRRVMAERASLMARAEPVLRDAHHIAAVDVGWVSAVSEADIMDLAGLTDPEIAALPGGHTSKHVSGSMVLDRDVDVIVLWKAHTVSFRIARDPVTTMHYERQEDIPLGPPSSGAGYVVFTRRAPL
jgi:hypothetical protein